jgi:hypothetical protein
MTRRSAFRSTRTGTARVVTAALVALAAPAAAQVQTAPEPLTPAPFLIHRAPDDLDALTRSFNASDWDALQQLARDVVCVARQSAGQRIEPDDPHEYASCGAGENVPRGPVADALDLARNHVALLWMGTDAFGKTRLMRTVVEKSRGPRHGVDLPGLSASGGRGLTELFLSRSLQGRIASQYTSTREDDPLLAQVPAFVQSVAGPLFSTIGTLAGRIPGVAAETVREAVRPRIAATVKRVGLPFRRASVRLQAVAREPVSSAAFAGEARRAAADLSFDVVPHAPCARALAQTLADELPPVTQTATCSAPAADPLECLAAFDAVITRSFDEAVGGCESGKPSRDAVAAMRDVDEAFRTLVRTGTALDAELDVTFKNRPAAHFAFGAGAAVMVATSLTRPRVDTKSGVIVADPLNRVMTTAFVNWSPTGYDEKAPSMTAAERFRLFFGAALTPDFGPVAGVNVLLVRGLGVTIGGALLFGKGADASEIGTRPSRPDDPYELAITRAAFVGLSYNYK